MPNYAFIFSFSSLILHFSIWRHIPFFQSCKILIYCYLNVNVQHFCLSSSSKSLITHIFTVSYISYISYPWLLSYFLFLYITLCILGKLLRFLLQFLNSAFISVYSAIFFFFQSVKIASLCCISKWPQISWVKTTTVYFSPMLLD